MRIGLTYNLKPDGADGDRYEEFDSLMTIEALESALRSCGHEPVRLGWGAAMLDALATNPVDGVFNLAEGVGGRGRESQVPATLEMLGIPCTGSDAVAIGITLDKALAKLMARASGIATAPWTMAGMEEQPLRYPLFVKPAAEGSSMGVTAKSLCRDQSELSEALARVREYGPALVEEFLPGNEYTVGILAGNVIAVMQVVPKGDATDFFYSLEVKHNYEQYVDYRIVDEPRVAGVALAVWGSFGLRDVARVDVRCDRDGIPNFVEVNPLPGVHPVLSDLVILVKAVGWTYDQLIAGIMASAEARWRG